MIEIASSISDFVISQCDDTSEFVLSRAELSDRRKRTGKFSLFCVPERHRDDIELKIKLQNRARQIAKLNIDGLFSVTELGTDPRCGFYIIFEEVRGVSLREIVRACESGEVKISKAILVSMMKQVVDILKQMHASSVIHGRLGFDDIVADASGHCFVQGLLNGVFGDHTGHCEHVSPLPPEIRKGEATTEQADIYAVGAMIFRLLCRKEHPDEWQPRWTAMMMELDAASVAGEAISGFVDFFYRTLAERPSQRYKSMSALQGALQYLLADLGGEKDASVIAYATEALIPQREASDEIIDLFDDGENTVEAPRMDPAPQRVVGGETTGAERAPVTRQSLRNLSPALRDSSTLRILAATRYQILAELGSGGTGAVYKVLDTTLSETMALKVLRPELVSDSVWLSRFKRELKISRDLEHPHILPAYHLEQIEGIYFFTMKFVDGFTLFKFLKENPHQDFKLMTKILYGVGCALAEAHKHGIIHRDIKSANVMLDRKTLFPYLMDFGIAYSSVGPQLTMAGQGIGTPFYMAPEQSRGENIDPLADIYSFGVLAYEAYTGVLPFSGNTAVAIYNEQMQRNFAPLNEIAPFVPRELSDTIDACLSPDKKDRPKGMTAINRILNQYLDEDLC